MSDRGYALHSVCPKLPLFLFLAVGINRQLKLDGMDEVITYAPLSNPRVIRIRAMMNLPNIPNYRSLFILELISRLIAKIIRSSRRLDRWLHLER